MPRLSAGDVVAERFVVESKVARGGCAAIYKVVETGTLRPFALKVAHRTDSGASAMIDREADLLTRFTHGALCRCCDRGRLKDGRAFLVLDWVDGVTVEHLIKVGPLAIDVAYGIALALVDVLALLHSDDVIHGDVKPLNVLVPSVDGQHHHAEPKLIDFGIAHVLTHVTDSGEPRSAIGRCVGTADYMAPEQLAGRRHGLGTDIYGLGGTLFAMLFGRPPYVDSELARVVPPQPGMPRPFMGSLVVRKLTEPAVIPVEPSLPAALRALLTHMLELRLEDRPRSIESIRSRLDEIAKESSATRAVGFSAEKQAATVLTQ